MSTPSASRRRQAEHGEADALAPPASRSRQRSWTDRAIEGCWLAAAAFLPIFILPETTTVGFVQVPKVLLLRTLALLATVLVVVGWAISHRQGQSLAADVAGWRAWLRDILGHAKRNPIVASAIAVLLTTTLSAVLSPVPVVSIEGTRPGWDTYALYNVLAYVTLFGIVAARMRSRAQVERLVVALTGAAMLLGLYGIGQRFGVDPFRIDNHPAEQVTLTLGNPIFGASVLLLSIPLTLAWWQTKRDEVGRAEHIVLGAAMIVLQLTTFAFTLARGGFVGLVLAGVVFAGLTVWVHGRRAIAPPALSFLAAAAIAFSATFIPVPGGASDGGGSDLIDRVGSIAPTVAGATGNLGLRFNTWDIAATVMLTSVWPDSEAYPELPRAGLEPGRLLVGYGPDMFGPAQLLVGDPTQQTVPDHAHNFPIHIAVENGLLGLAAYGALVLFVGLAIAHLVLDAKRGRAPAWVAWIAIGAAAVFMGRLLEQQVGKAQIGDLTMAWVLAGSVVALLRMRNAGWPEPTAAASAHPNTQRRNRRSQQQRAAPPSAPLSVSHVVLAAVVSIGALAWWWTAIGSTAYAESMAGRAIMSILNGEPVEAAQTLDSAIGVSSKNYTPRYVMSISWQNAGRGSDEPQDQGQALVNALAVLQPVLDRDPLNRQAAVRRANLLTSLASLNREAYWDEAKRAWEVVLILTPGLWEPARGAAAAFISYGESEPGLEIVRHLREKGAMLEPNVLDYLEAKALLQLGRTAEAQPLIDHIAASDHESAPSMLEELAAVDPE